MGTPVACLPIRRSSTLERIRKMREPQILGKQRARRRVGSRLIVLLSGQIWHWAIRPIGEIEETKKELKELAESRMPGLTHRK